MRTNLLYMKLFRAVLFRKEYVLHVLFLTTIAFCHSAESREPDHYTVSVVPQSSIIETYNAWSPVLDKLSKETGLIFELKLAKSIPDFEMQLHNNEVDFAFMNPYHVVIFHDKGYIPIIRNAENLLRGIIVARKDSSINQIHDLEGHEVAFPAPNSFGASLYTRAQLNINHIHINPLYVKTHSNVYRSVLMGDTMAGGGVNLTYEQEPDEVHAQLKIIYTSPQFPSHPICANARIPASIRSNCKVIQRYQ
jgi:phosphonate transport system substrate-binding protein